MKTLADTDVFAEAWKMILDGAESYVEDAIDEDGNFDEETWEAIYEKAIQVIKNMRMAGIDKPQAE